MSDGDRAATGAFNLTLHIAQMCCPTEERVIRQALAGLAGVEALDFNLIQRRLRVAHRLDDPAPLLSALDKTGLGYLVEPQGIPPQAAPAAGQGARPVFDSRRAGLLLGLVASIAAEALALASGDERSWPVILLALGAIALTGPGVYKKGWIALRNRDLNINALMSIAVTGAALLGQWPEAAMVMVLFALAENIEAHSLDRARNAIQGLMALAPDRATVRQADGDWRAVDAAGVDPGAVARVAPGERIALDGEVIAGRSAVNQAPITGESMPVPKEVGDLVFAGTVNETGSFEYRVTARHADSTLSRIIRAVEEAQASRAPTQRMVDRFAAIYTPAVFLLALLLAVLPPLLWDGQWETWIYRALVLLVIGCPCALVISTPVTIASGLAATAKAGILVKGGIFLEVGSRLRAVAFDKTGTITHGKPRVIEVVVLQGNMGQGLRLAASLAASLVARSDHPVSEAIARHWKTAGQLLPLAGVREFEALPGRGIKGWLGGAVHYLGNRRLLADLGIRDAAAETALDRLEAAGMSAVVLCSDGAARAVIGVADAIKETSRDAVAELHRLGIRTVMLTGDNAVSAAAIGREAGIDDTRANLLPENKLAAIDAELSRYGAVAMVGDGINDAPALAKASIGFAMGGAGSDAAIETADVAVMDDDPRKIGQFVRLSRQTTAILRQNIIMALAIKLVFLALAAAGLATLWMAVFADMGASLLVVFNGLRLLRAETPGGARAGAA
jgi:Cd2+/Zn2+-exporting ATPase